MANLPSIDVEQAILDPSAMFDKPRDVLDSNLAEEDQRRILEAWELDAQRQAESASEGMAGGDASMSLRAVKEALAQIG